MSLQWHDVVGGTGVAVLLGTYLLLQLNRLSAQSLRYSVLNAVGSGLILLSLTQAFNLSAFVIEACWLAISIIGASLLFAKDHLWSQFLPMKHRRRFC